MNGMRVSSNWFVSGMLLACAFVFGWVLAWMVHRFTPPPTENVKGAQNMCMGNGCLAEETGDHNTYVGPPLLLNGQAYGESVTSGQYTKDQIAHDKKTVEKTPTRMKTSGSKNMAVGAVRWNKDGSLEALTTGSNNTCPGTRAGRNGYCPGAESDPAITVTPLLTNSKGEGIYQEDFDHLREGQTVVYKCNADQTECMRCLDDDHGNEICQWIDKRPRKE